MNTRYDHRLNWTMPLPKLGALVRTKPHIKPITQAPLLDEPVWREGFPPTKGWWIVGSTGTRYNPKMMRMHFDGMAWREFVGLIDPGHRGRLDFIDPEKVRAIKIMWLRECQANELYDDHEEQANA